MLEEFFAGEGSDELSLRWELAGFTDEDARRVMPAPELGGLFQLTGGALTQLGDRYELLVRPEDFVYSLGAEATDGS